MNAPRTVRDQIARVDEVLGRIDRNQSSRAAEHRLSARRGTMWMRRLIAAAIGIFLVMVATTTIGLILNGIGLIGFVFSLIVMAAVALFFMVPRSEKPMVDYKDDMPNKAVVERLDSLLVRKRAALPAPALRRVDAISAQLPQLESRLAATDMLDPLAQDARRLMGRHLPELIERYERVPAAYRGERDAEGLTVDERLVQGLDAAGGALDELGRKLAREDMDAFQTQGRFITSRYKEDGELQG
jgi:hypothetical protein